MSAMLLVALIAIQARADEDLGPNGGIRLLLTVEPYDFPAGGITADPCTLMIPLLNPDDFVTDWPAGGDTVIVWAYLYHPSDMAVCGLGFGIEYAGIDFLTSGVCAPYVMQDPNVMGRWADSGSEIVFAWDRAKCLAYRSLLPVAWFVMQTPVQDGYFRLTAGSSSYGGMVADTSGVTRSNLIWDYGQIGFGETAGKLPVIDPATVPAAWGAAGVSVR